MKFLVTLFAVLLITAIVAHLAVNEPGYVLLGYGKTSLEMPLIDFLVLLLFLLLTTYLFIRLLLHLTHAPEGFKRLRQKQHANQSRRGLIKGLTAMTEGEWEASEKYLLRSAGNSDTPILNYLAAAHVAQRQAALDRRDDYLALASRSEPKAELAVGLSRAGLQMEQGQYEEALATLKQLEQVVPKHRVVKKLLARLFLKLKDWESLNALLPLLHKQKAMSEEELAALEAQAVSALMQQAGQKGDLVALRKIWKGLPRQSTRNSLLLKVYAKALIRMKESTEAETLLRKALDQQWDNDLAEIYGGLDLENPQDVLTHANQWLDKHGKSPELLAALGRISAKAKLWGKARSLLRESIHLKPTAQAYQALASLHEQMREPEAAKATYEEGFRLLAEKTSNDSANF
ncbi:MAG TPA: heme biosynthesis protein HemY [Gammaproteobacteria bacterium]|nr:heme biosynthesis protein HemY [Gammaproteobacteria bacterium]